MFHEITLKLYFMKCIERKISQFILPFRDFFSRHIVAFFEASVLKEVCILRYLHNISANTKVKLSYTLLGKHL